MSHVAVLEQMYAEEFSRAGLEGWLEEKSIYQISNRAIAAALPSLCEEVSAQDPLQERLRKQQACAEVDVIRDLRALARNRDVPFHYVGQEIRIGVPAEDDQPDPGRASACSDGEWHGQDIELTNPSLDLVAAAIKQSVVFPQLQAAARVPLRVGLRRHGGSEAFRR